MIKVTIKDRDELFKVSPRDIELYLVSQLWSFDKMTEHGYLTGKLFSNVDKSSSILEIFVPDDAFRENPAYPGHVAQALATLEKLENRSQLEIWADMTMRTIVIEDKVF